MGFLQRLAGKSVDWFAAALVIAMTGFVFFQVTNRYILASPIPWTEEAARIMFIWTTFVGAYIALTTKSHISTETFVKRYFSQQSQGKISNFLTFFLVYFVGYLLWVSLQVVRATAGSTTPVLRISFLYIHVAIPIISTMMLLYLITQIFRMGWKQLVFGGLLSLAIVAALCLIFGITPHNGQTLVLVSLVCMGVLILLGMPIVFSMGIACALFLYLRNVPYVVLHTRMIGGIDSFPLLAVPFFILAGELLNTGGVTHRLVALAKVFVGSIRGGLAMVVVVGEYFFSGMSGSTVADVSAIGSLMVPALRKAGYKADESVSIVSAASAMGILVPPSIQAVVLAPLTGLSVGALFAGGFLPAIVIALCIMALIYIQAVRSNMPIEKRLSFKESMGAVVGAIIPLLCPVIIFGGILTGFATPTEVSVVAVMYAFIVGVFIYREIKWNQIIPILVRTAVTTGTVMLLVGIAAVLSWMFSTNQVPQLVGTAVSKISKSPLVFLLLSNLSFILVGAITEGLPAMLILTPIFLPFTAQFGVDPLHFGILVIASLGIGLFLPPIGIGMFIACTFGEIDIGKIFRSFTPFLIVLLVGLFIITYIPWFTLVLPEILFPAR